MNSRVQRFIRPEIPAQRFIHRQIRRGASGFRAHNQPAAADGRSRTPMLGSIIGRTDRPDSSRLVFSAGAIALYGFGIALRCFSRNPNPNGAVIIALRWCIAQGARRSKMAPKRHAIARAS
jgi:hypothetical protein